MRCTWCDSEYTFTGGEHFPIEEVLERVRTFGCNLVEITGGEPLAQREGFDLIRRLCDEDFEVLIETGGYVSTADVDPRAKIILEDGPARPFEAFDRVAMFEKSKGKSLADLLDIFAQLREQNLEELNKLNLTPELLDKRGTHPELGVVTLKQLLATWVIHDLGHIRQVVRVMAKQYSEEVGPWKAYLSILDE